MSVRTITLPSGAKRHQVRWREGDRHRSRNFPRKGDAEVFDDEVKRRTKLGPLAVQQLTVRGPTLNSWVRDRWAPEHAATLEMKTRDRYASSYKVHIEPWLGHLPLQDLTVGRLREWQAQRVAQGARPDALDKARQVLSSVLRHAAESEVIPGNPLSLVRKPKAPHKEPVIALSPRQVEQLRVILRPRDQIIVSLLAYSGIRPGELRALRWGDIGTNTILVARAANPDGTVKSTKTRGHRNVRLLEHLRQDLADWKRTSGARGGRELVVPAEDGSVLTEEAWGSWRGRVWAPARGLVIDHPAVPYSLRHSFASLLLAEGRTVHYVAEQLGHDAGQTLSRYGHLIAEYADSANIDIDDEIAAARGAAAAALAARPTPLPKLGARQWEILGRLNHAGAAGLRFPTFNDRRAAEALVARGLVDVADGTRTRARFVLSEAGERLVTTYDKEATDAV